MSLIAIAAATAGAKIIGGEIAKQVAKKKGRKAEAEINKQTAAQSKELAGQYEAKQQAEKDLGNIYKGMESISPETQYARNANERGTATAIERATRSGASTSEIMNMVSGLTSKGQQATERISASEASRRKEAAVAAGTQAVRAAQVGLAGKEAQIQLQDKAYQKTLQKQAQINQAVGQNYNFYASALGDLGSAAMMDAGGSIDPLTGAFTVGSGTGKAYGTNMFGGLKKSAKQGANRRAASRVNESSVPSYSTGIYKSPDVVVHGSPSY